MIMKKLLLLLLCAVAASGVFAADKAKPVVSILGDSYSTFDGYIPEGNASWYFTNTQNGRTDVTDVRQTWWWQLISEGGYIEKGATYLVLKDGSVGDGVGSSKLSLESAKNQLESAKKSLDDYSVTAPISGTVITKNAKEGDNINAAYNSSLAVIYDLSKVKFKMQIDELDVLKISVGQEVSVRADALEGVEMTGHITNISLEANTSGGVTEYPVTVELDEVGDLLPGMNVSATIVLKEEKDALCIPVDALMRGDVVYMKNGEGEETTPEELAAGVPEGFHEVKVTVGISSDSYVQILSGLKPEDEVYVPRAEMTDMYGLMMGTDDYYYEEEEDVE